MGVLSWRHDSSPWGLCAAVAALANGADDDVVGGGRCCAARDACGVDDVDAVDYVVRNGVAWLEYPVGVRRRKCA